MRLARLSSLALVVVLALAAPGLAGDTTPPTVTEVRALDGVGGEVVLPATLDFEPASLVVTFSEDIDAATVSVDTFRLVGNGGDGTFGDGNEVEIALASVTLSPANVATMDLGGAAVPDEDYQITVSGVDVKGGLVAHWTLDDGGGQVATDSSGNGNDGTLGSTAGVDSSDPTWVAGRKGGALGFDGSDDYVDLGDDPSLNFTAGESFTAAGWILTSEAYGPIMSLRNSTDGQPVMDVFVGYDGTDSDPGKLICLVRSSAVGRIAGGKVDDGTWHHFAVSRSSAGTIELFFDGTTQGTSSDGGGAISTDIRALGSERRWVAAGYGTEDQRFLSGLIDDIRIYGRALSIEEVASLAAGAPPPVTDLAGNVLDGDANGAEGPDYECLFTVEAVAPTVESTSPGDSDIDVVVDTAITVMFSERMNETDTAFAFSISPVVAGTAICAGDVLTFTPDADLASETLYTVTVDTGAKDLADKPIAADHVFTFTTRDAIPPTVTDIRADGVLLPGATLDFAPASIVVTFSEDIDPTTVNTDTFRLVRSGGDGTFWDGNEVEITPASVTLTAGNVVTVGLGGAALESDTYEVVVRSCIWTPWGLAVNLSEVNTSAEDFLGTLSTDGLELFMGSFRSGGLGDADIWRSTRPDASSPWSAPTNVTELNSGGWDGLATLSGDGLTIWFPSTRSGGSGYTDIWAAERPDRSSSWSTPVNVSEINGSRYESHPVVSPDGLTLWFSEGPSGGTSMYVTTRVSTSDPWGPPTAVDELNTSTYQEMPGWVSADQLTFWYHTNRSGTYSIWRAERPSVWSVWSAPVEVSELSGSGMSYARWVSADGETMYFYSNRPGGLGNTDVWMTQRSATGLSDLSANLLDGEFTGSLPSGDGTAGGDFVCTFEITAPTVLVTSPAPDAVNVPVTAMIEATFSRAMDQAATAAAFIVSGGVTGTKSWAGNTLVLTPAQPLANDHYYTVTITTGAKDATGVPLAGVYTFNFTTVAENATTPFDGGCAAGPAVSFLAPFALLCLALVRCRRASLASWR